MPPVVTKVTHAKLTSRKMQEGIIWLNCLVLGSLRSKRSRTKRTKFWPRVLVFCILDAMHKKWGESGPNVKFHSLRKGTLATQAMFWANVNRIVKQLKN